MAHFTWPATMSCVLSMTIRRSAGAGAGSGFSVPARALIL
uniref:Uncharacterized protein n=1 Tax=Arundo donax TaxID=35708 RepID=A0A0A9BV46_ARUDO